MSRWASRLTFVATIWLSRMSLSPVADSRTLLPVAVVVVPDAMSIPNNASTVPLAAVTSTVPGVPVARFAF